MHHIRYVSVLHSYNVEVSSSSITITHHIGVTYAVRSSHILATFTHYIRASHPYTGPASLIVYIHVTFFLTFTQYIPASHPRARCQGVTYTLRSRHTHATFTHYARVSAYRLRTPNRRHIRVTFKWTPCQIHASLPRITSARHIRTPHPCIMCVPRDHVTSLSPSRI